MPEKKGLLGLSRPVLIGIVVLILFLLITGFLAGPIGKKLFGDVGIPEWLIVERPTPTLPVETIFHIAGFPVSNSVIAAWITIVFLVVVSYIATRRIKLVPGRLQTIVEFFLGWIYDLCQTVAGEKNGRRFFPLVVTIFLFVMFNAWLGLLPGYGSIFVTNAEGHTVHLLRPANTDINLPLALAFISFFAVWYYGLRYQKIGYLKQFFNFGPLFCSLGQLFTGKIKAGFGGLIGGIIGVFVGLLELLSVFIRIVSFTFRLFGNMTAGEILLLLTVFLVPWVVVLIFYGLELLVGFVQALIFALLTLVFLTAAITAHSEETHTSTREAEETF